MSSKKVGEYTLKEKIGVGSFGTVYKAVKKGDRTIYVLKQISLFNLSQQEIEEVENEAKILQSIDSSYIVKCFVSFKEESNLNIVMEFCDAGDLAQFLNVNQQLGKQIPEERIWKYFIQMCLGLAHIHGRKILHRDIKSMNMFMTKEDKIKIGDLGVAKVLMQTQFAKTFVGTPYYLSPEICEEKPYNEKSDIWALGCILYELCTFKHPFNATNQAALILKILRGKYDPIPKEYSQELRKLIDYILQKNHNTRPNVIQLLTHLTVLSKAKELKLYETISTDPYVNSQTNFFNVTKENKTTGNLIKEIKKKESVKVNNINLELNPDSAQAQASETNVKFKKLASNERMINLNVPKNIKKNHLAKKEVKDSRDLKKLFISGSSAFAVQNNSQANIKEVNNSMLSPPNAIPNHSNPVTVSDKKTALPMQEIIQKVKNSGVNESKSKEKAVKVRDQLLGLNYDCNINANEVKDDKKRLNSASNTDQLSYLENKRAQGKNEMQMQIANNLKNMINRDKEGYRAQERDRSDSVKDGKDNENIEKGKSEKKIVIEHSSEAIPANNSAKKIKIKIETPKKKSDASATNANDSSSCSKSKEKKLHLKRDNSEDLGQQKHIKPDPKYKSSNVEKHVQSDNINFAKIRVLDKNKHDEYSFPSVVYVNQAIPLAKSDVTNDDYLAKDFLKKNLKKKDYEKEVEDLLDKELQKEASDIRKNKNRIYEDEFESVIVQTSIMAQARLDKAISSDKSRKNLEVVTPTQSQEKVRRKSPRDHLINKRVKITPKREKISEDSTNLATQSQSQVTENGQENSTVANKLTKENLRSELGLNDLRTETYSPLKSKLSKEKMELTVAPKVPLCKPKYNDDFNVEEVVKKPRPKQEDSGEEEEVEHVQVIDCSEDENNDEDDVMMQHIVANDEGVDEQTEEDECIQDNENIDETTATVSIQMVNELEELDALEREQQIKALKEECSKIYIVIEENKKLMRRKMGFEKFEEFFRKFEDKINKDEVVEGNVIDDFVAALRTNFRNIPNIENDFTRLVTEMCKLESNERDLVRLGTA